LQTAVLGDHGHFSENHVYVGMGVQCGYRGADYMPVEVNVVGIEPADDFALASRKAFIQRVGVATVAFGDPIERIAWAVIPSTPSCEEVYRPVGRTSIDHDLLDGTIILYFYRSECLF
jgi:hypothetical protein